jgi:hypothetical protein
MKITNKNLLIFCITLAICGRTITYAQPSTNGLILWLDSSYVSSVQTNGNGSITNWLNHAPGATNGVSYTGKNDNDTSASFNSNAPIYGSSTNSRGQGVVNFNGNGYLDNLNFSSETPLDLTIFVLASATTNRGDFSAFMAFNESQSDNDYQTGLNFDQGQDSSSTFDRLNVEGAKGGGGGGFQLLNGSQLAFGTFYLFEIDYGGGSVDNDSVFNVSVNGAIVGSVDGSPTPVNLVNCYIGARAFATGYTAGANNGMIGQIAAVLVYDHQLTNTDLTQTRNYLNNFFAPPDLNITLASSNGVVISWPDTRSYILQQNNNLAAPAGWTTSGYSITAAAGTNSIAIMPPAGKLFFRLSTP